MPSNVATSYSQGPLLPWIVCPLASPCFRVVATAGIASVDDLWRMVAHVMPLASGDYRPKL